MSRQQETHDGYRNLIVEDGLEMGKRAMVSDDTMVGAMLAVIYPNGRGHFALGSPDGDILFPGQSLTILLAGHQVAGIIQASEQGDYLRAEDGTTCGLCACMRVVATHRTSATN